MANRTIKITDYDDGQVWYQRQITVEIWSSASGGYTKEWMNYGPLTQEPPTPSNCRAEVVWDNS